MRLFFIALFMAALTGCAGQGGGLYQWGGYEQGLYASYKDPNKVEDLRITLEKQIADTEGQSQKIAPGLYAELGTLYLQAGDTGKAITLYSKERDAWPESRGLMTTMIKNIERRQQKKSEEKK